MKIQSLIEDNNQLKPVQVELTLWPGLPGFQFLGLPDQHLKESALRIKSAIKSAGFQFPVAQQILVNLRPSYLKKSSRGLELAVAAAYLWETGQVPMPSFDEKFFVYGELTLSGEVLEPENLVGQFFQTHGTVLTGASQNQKSEASFRRQTISDLAELGRPQEKLAAKDVFNFKRPTAALSQKFTQSQARLLEILSVGEHSAMIAGPAGSGKTTIGKSLPSFLREPSFAQKENLRLHLAGAISDWRPFIKPHHTTPTIAMVGGGSVPGAGEIAKAHGGVLMLDELLEFANPVQEALREPFEEWKMRVSRAGRVMEYPVEAQIVATTNLCPCGNWTPGAKVTCTQTRAKCRSYSNRLSGPFLDRFEILEFTKPMHHLTRTGDEILEKVSQAQKFSKDLFKDSLDNFKGVNARRPVLEILKTMKPEKWKLAGSEEMSSQRRKLAVLRVARTLADLELSAQIKTHHLDEAIKYCKTNFNRLTNLS